MDEGEDLSQSRRVTEMREADIGTVIVDGAVDLHQVLGPGLLEIVHSAL